MTQYMQSVNTVIHPTDQLILKYAYMYTFVITKTQFVHERGWHSTYTLLMKPHVYTIAGLMDPEFWFTKISINLLNMALNSSSQNVKWRSNMGRFGTYSIIGGNIRLLIEKI